MLFRFRGANKMKKINIIYAAVLLAMLVCLAACGQSQPLAYETSEPEVRLASAETTIQAEVSVSFAPDVQAQSRIFHCTDGTVEEYIVLNLDFTGYWITDSAYPIAWDPKQITVFPGTEDSDSLGYVCGSGTLRVDGKTFSVVQEMPQEVQAMLAE